MLNRSRFKQRVASGRTAWAAGAYDCLSALCIAEAGFDAVTTTGFGISASMLGEADAELYTLTENVTVVRNIVNALDVPLIADADSGYGNAINVIRTVREFEGAGVAALILEDQVSPKRCPLGDTEIAVLPIEESVGKVRAAVDARRDPELMIIARTDVNDPAEAVRRAKAYVAAGADIVQPVSRCFSSFEALRTFRREVAAPLSLQLLSWLETELTPEQVEEIAALATFTFVPLMTVRHALKSNLEVLAKLRKTSDLPLAREHYADFTTFIGFPRIKNMQEKYIPRI